MATITFKKGDDYLAKISQLEILAKHEVVGPAIYGAAEIVADEIRRQLDRVPTDESFATSSNPAKGPKKVQKEGLVRSLGIASMQEDSKGFLNVKIGFDGYNKVKTKRWPQGQPNQMVARSVERGTLYMKSTKFVKTAVAATRSRAVQHMKESVDDSIEKIMTRS